MKLRVLFIQAILVISAFNTKTNAADETPSTAPPARLHRFFTTNAMQYTPNITDDQMRMAIYVLSCDSYQTVIEEKAYSDMTQDKFNQILGIWNVKEVYGSNAYVTTSQMRDMYRNYIAKKTGQPVSNVTNLALRKVALQTTFEPMPHVIRGLYDVYGFTDEGAIEISDRDTAYTNERIGSFLWNGTKIYYTATGCGNITDKRTTSTPGTQTIYREQFDHVREMYASNPEPNNVNVNVNVSNNIPQAQGNSNPVPFFLPQQQQAPSVVKVEMPDKIKVEGMTLNNIFAGITAASSVFGNFQQARTNKLLQTDIFLDMFGGNNQQVIYPQPRYRNDWPVYNGGGGGGYVNQGGFQGNSDPYSWLGNSGNNYGSGSYTNGGYYNNGNNGQYGNQWGSNPRVNGYMDQMSWLNGLQQRTYIQDQQDYRNMMNNGGVLTIGEGLGTSRFRQPQTVNNPAANLFGGGGNYTNGW